AGATEGDPAPEAAGRSARRGGQARRSGGQHRRPGQRRGHSVRLGDLDRRGRSAGQGRALDRQEASRDGRRARQAARPLRGDGPLPRGRGGDRARVGGARMSLPRRAIVAAWLAAALFVTTTTAATAPSKSSAKKSQKPKATSDSVLVRIGKETITTGQVQRRLDELPEHVRPQFTTPEGRQRLVDRLIEEKVWLMSATKAG